MRLSLCGLGRFEEENSIMGDFNLQTLYDFRPARFLCEKCLALLVEAPFPRETENPRCPICSVEYVPTTRRSRYDVDAYLTSHGPALEYADLLEHCNGLAQAIQPSGILGPKPHLRILLDAISRAKHFVHFTSFGIFQFFIGVLKLLAQRVSVCGVVSNVDERTLDEITALKEDAPKLEINHYVRAEWRTEEAPHQKLIVIDGLIAFKGSANFTLSGWRKAAKGLDHVETVTRVKEVIDLHNKLFSPVWERRSKTGGSIEMAF